MLLACEPAPRFILHSPDETGITFSNTITESDSINILANEYIYNGGGVGVADFDRDGNMDLMFSGNMVSNRLYLNHGDWKFEDVTSVAGVGGEQRWSSGVSIVDINRDGWPDIHVCATNRDDDPYRDNQLYIHQGLNEAGIPVFQDLAREYGLLDQSHSTHAAFFDYDNDGDLDIIIIVDEVEASGAPNTFRPKKSDGTAPTTDRLYRNDWNDSLGHPVFTDVSREAGILHEGYSLGVNITDLNRDGWKDIFITNDFVTNDLFYLNQGDGTFKDVAPALFKHTCHSAMGNDVVDLDNDGRMDILALDMMPEDNFRKKTMLMSNNYNSYLSNNRLGYTYQYVRNVYQHNEGFNPQTGLPLFAEVGMMAGIAQTDWSWTPSAADFDNDGKRDLLITNGFPKDITDRDFVNYHSEVFAYANYQFLKDRIPSVKLNNYGYRNEGGMTFSDQSEAWGLKIPSFSSGAVYVDLDNDGDLDWVVNNIDDPAFVYENAGKDQAASNWLNVQLKGDDNNPDAYGTWVEIWAGGEHQIWEHSPFRGYLSSVDPRIHFGLGTQPKIDSIRIIRPDGLSRLWKELEPNQWLQISLTEGSWTMPPASPSPSQPLFTDHTHSLQLMYCDRDSDFVDFNIQRLLPHKLSQYGPGLAVSDVNGDGLEDLYVTGPHFKRGLFFIQNPDGTFDRRNLLANESGSIKMEEELGALFFDADGDGDQDLYLVSGGYEFDAGHPAYQDRLFLNEGDSFRLAKAALPALTASGSCVKAVDYDHDGDLDLFVGGRVVPSQYPKPATSYLLRNESRDGKARFVIDEQANAVFGQLGMVSDALWTDYDSDGWVDLIMAGEWMPLTLLHNEAGTFRNMTQSAGLASAVGWWNSLAGGDFDRDGDIDYIAGNLGLNTLFQASDAHPVGIYAADFDGNGGYDAIPTQYLRDSTGAFQEFPFYGRLDVEKQLVGVKKQFPYHAQFARSTMAQFLKNNAGGELLTYHANYLQSSWIENLGNGTFTIHPLPTAVQTSPVYGMVVDDLNLDGYPDVVMVGNDFGNELTAGRYDASNGWVLWNGPDGFQVRSYDQTGFLVSGDAKALVKLQGNQGQIHYVASQNQDSLRVFSTHGSESLRLAPGQALDLQYPDGSKQRVEGYCGSSFLSQSSPTFSLPHSAIRSN